VLGKKLPLIGSFWSFIGEIVAAYLKLVKFFFFLVNPGQPFNP
jgi:hypothetical protein